MFWEPQNASLHHEGGDILWLLKLMFRSERQFPEECAAERTDLSEQAVDFIQNHW